MVLVHEAKEEDQQTQHETSMTLCCI